MTARECGGVGCRDTLPSGSMSWELLGFLDHHCMETHCNFLTFMSTGSNWQFDVRLVGGYLSTVFAEHTARNLVWHVSHA